jgi:hypothetical protein
LTFHLALDPMSLVSEAEASDAFTRVLVPELTRVPFLIAAPVSLTVACAALPSTWHPDAVEYPNLERWLRPLIDALSGTDRLLASPSLVGSITVATRGPGEDVRRLSIAVGFPSDRVLVRKPLRVVALGRGLTEGEAGRAGAGAGASPAGSPGR